MTFRALEERDVPWVVETLRHEGWNFDAREVRRLLALGGGLLAEDRGEPIAMLTHTVHGDAAWIGNVVVLAPARGRGLGEALVADALTELEARGVRTVGLYSVPKAVNLYARLGFRREGDVASWTRPAAPAPAAPHGIEPLKDLVEARAIDLAAFGADRGRFLTLLLEAHGKTAIAARDPAGRLEGFAFLKPSPAGGEIGPLVVTTSGGETAAKRLLDAALANARGPVEAGFDPAHPFARTLLESRGFAPGFVAVAMTRGRPLAPRSPEGAVLFGAMEKG